MEDKKSNVNKKPNGSLRVNISADEDTIKYYECNYDNCIFEIINNDTTIKNTNIIAEINRMAFPTPNKALVVSFLF